MLEIYKFFKADGYGLKDFTEDWKTLSEKDKDEVRKGIENGTMTY